jgi:uncharacterized membrane protein
LPPGQQFCGACGQPVGVAPVHNRVARHVQMMGVLWLIYGSLELIGGVVLLFVSHVILAQVVRHPDQANPIPDFLKPLLSTIAAFILAKSALCLTGAVGLLQRGRWARLVILVAAFISLINMPLGTALGIYTLWVLLADNGQRQYEALATG